MSTDRPTHDTTTHLRDELEALTTEATDATPRRHRPVSTLEAAQRMNAGDRSVPAALEPCLPAIALAADSIAAAFARGGRLVYVGAGTPGRLGVLDASECPPTFGTDPSQVVGVIAGGDVRLDHRRRGRRRTTKQPPSATSTRSA